MSNDYVEIYGKDNEESIQKMREMLCGELNVDGPGYPSNILLRLRMLILEPDWNWTPHEVKEYVSKAIEFLEWRQKLHKAMIEDCQEQDGIL